MTPFRRSTLALLLLAAALAAACTPGGSAGSDAPPAAPAIGAAAASAAQAAPTALPAGAAEARQRLANSPRHGEWVMVRTGAADSVRAWVVYPERAERSPVVLVVHEIFGLSHWIRAVADQLAAEGFIAIAPDLLTMQNVPEGADGAPDPEVARTVIRALQRDDIHRQLRAVAEYGMALPAALPTYGIVGFCWGGTVAFDHAAESPSVGASVVFYGTSPAAETLGRVRAPVLGLYGEDDERVNATIPAAETALRARVHPFETQMYAGAGHGFLRAQDGREGANLRASEGAWPRTVEWFRTHLATGAP
jgi:carboxymethylenebutenolidase